MQLGRKYEYLFLSYCNIRLYSQLLQQQALIMVTMSVLSLDSPVAGISSRLLICICGNGDAHQVVTYIVQADKNM